MHRIAAIVAVAFAATVPAATAAAPLRFASPPSGLALQGGSLWVSLAADGILLQLDARTGRRLRTIETQKADRRALGGGTLATGVGVIWVAAPVHVDDDPAVGNASGWIGRLDPRLATLRVTQVHGDPPAQVAVGAGSVWVAGGRTLRRVDPRSGRVTASVRIGRYVGDVAASARSVWVDLPNAGTILRLDARTRRVVGSAAVGRSTSGTSLALGRLLWAATDAGVVAVDPATDRVVRRVALPHATAVAADGDRVWALTPRGLYRIAADGRATRASAGAAGLLAARAGTVWLSDSASNTLRRASG